MQNSPMSPRDVIAVALHCAADDAGAHDMADDILAALTASGLSIVPVASGEVGELVEGLARGLRSDIRINNEWGRVVTGQTDRMQEAASTLESLAAENARLTEEYELGRVASDGQYAETWKARAEAAEAANAELRAALEKAEKTIRACQWFWPDDDTSSEAGCDSAQEVVENAYGWCKPNGEVIAVARGGIVETTYCAALSPAEDADSDNEFWVEEQTEEAAKAAIKAELDRRALLRKGGADV